MNRRVWVEVNLKTLVANYRKIVAKAKPAKVLCVLKANAYGLGVGAYAKALAGTGCNAFGVAEPFEALELLKVFSSSQFPVPHSPFPSVQILSSILADEIAPMVKAGVILPVTDLETANLISKAAVKAKVTAKVHFKLDTGMGRLGQLILPNTMLTTNQSLFILQNSVRTMQLSNGPLHVHVRSRRLMKTLFVSLYGC